MRDAGLVTSSMRLAFVTLGLVHVIAATRVTETELGTESAIHTKEGSDAKANGKPPTTGKHGLDWSGDRLSVLQGLTKLVEGNSRLKHIVKELASAEAKRLWRLHWIKDLADFPSFEREAWRRLRLPLGIRWRLFENLYRFGVKGREPPILYNLRDTLGDLFEEIAKSLGLDGETGRNEARRLRLNHWLQYRSDLGLFKDRLGLLDMPEKLVWVLEPRRNMDLFAIEGKQSACQKVGVLEDQESLWSVFKEHAGSCGLPVEAGLELARRLGHDHWLETVLDLRRVYSIRYIWEGLELPMRIKSRLAKNFQTSNVPASDQPSQQSSTLPWVIMNDPVTEVYKMGVPSDVKRYIVETLHRHWLFKFSHLRMLTDEQWSRLKVPAKLRCDLLGQLRQEEARQEHAASMDAESAFEMFRSSLRQELASLGKPVGDDYVAFAMSTSVSTVEGALVAVSKPYNISTSKIDVAAARLKKRHWITKVRELADVHDEEWAELGLPMLIENALRRLVLDAQRAFRDAAVDWAAENGIDGKPEDIGAKFREHMQGQRKDGLQKLAARLEAQRRNMDDYVVVGWLIDAVDERKEEEQIERQGLSDVMAAACADQPNRGLVQHLQELDLDSALVPVQSYLRGTMQKEQLQETLEELLRSKRSQAVGTEA